MEARGGPSRSGRLARRAGRDPGGRSRPGAPWPDDGVAVHVLPRRGEDHGRRPEGHAARRPHRSALWRRSPVQLRGVRVARTGVVVRPQRLRRDAPRTVRVRRQAHVRQLHDRGAEQRLLQGGDSGDHDGVRAGLPGGDGRLRADGHDGHLVRALFRTRPHESHQATDEDRGEQGGGEAGQEARGEAHREGADPRQPAGAVQAGGGGGRSVPHHQPAADRGPAP